LNGWAFRLAGFAPCFEKRFPVYSRMPIWLTVVILGVIEGITEFLPISSTGHLIIAERWLGMSQSELFNVVIQCGAVLAVLPLFPDRLKQFAFRWREKQTQDYAIKIAVAFFITGVGGLVLKKLGLRLTEDVVPIAWALFLGGVAFVAVEAALRGRPMKAEVTWPIVIAVGLAQLVAAAFPGTSRSGATILIALVLGLSRVAATEFTFLVGIPTMLAAGAYEIYKGLSHAPAGQQENWGMLAVGFVAAAVVSFGAVKWLLRYIQTHTFTIFGWYRIALAALLLFLAWRMPTQPLGPR
jgi:undecaprenyl-diphosphatase